MTTQTPTSTEGWQLSGLGQKLGWEQLAWNPSIALRQLGSTDVLVRMHAAGLNYRDISIIHGTYPLGADDGVVPGCDGAGEVIAVGDRVSRFHIGDRVIPFIAHTGYYGGSAIGIEAGEVLIGSKMDGTISKHGVFDQQGLVLMPASLTYEEGAVTSGTFATAWNALMGGSRPLRVGDCVLVQGSGGMSIATLQVAVAAGAVVIATTSSAAKGEKLKELGATHVINYREDTQWGATAKKLSVGGRGCTHVIENIGDAQSYKQSLAAVMPGGEIEVVGFLGTAAAGQEPGPGLFGTFAAAVKVRGIHMGTRQHLEEVLNAMEVKNIKPIIDSSVFYLKDLKAAYQYLDDQKAFGKVVIRNT